MQSWNLAGLTTRSRIRHRVDRTSSYTVIKKELRMQATFGENQNRRGIGNKGNIKNSQFSLVEEPIATLTPGLSVSPSHAYRISTAQLRWNERTDLIERNSTKLHLDRGGDIISSIRQRRIGHRERSSRGKGLELGNHFARRRGGRTERRGRYDGSRNARRNGRKGGVGGCSGVGGAVARLQVLVGKSRSGYLPPLPVSIAWRVHGMNS